MAKLPLDLVEAILERMGFSAHPTLDLAGLSELYAAWCQSVPTDNCCKLIALRSDGNAPLPGAEASDFFETWLKHGVGGTCWALHGAWFELLSVLGFNARRAISTMMVAPNLPPNHGSVIVEMNGRSYWVDGGIKYLKPLAIIPGRNEWIAHPAWGVQGHWLDDIYAIRWRALHLDDPFDCHLNEWPVDAGKFALQHEATREWSPFNYELNFAIVKGEERIGVGMGKAVRVMSDGTMVRSPLEDRVGYLVDTLGVSEELAHKVPDDVPTPPPPWSRKARNSATRPKGMLP